MTIPKEMFFVAKNILLTCIILTKKKLSAFDDSRTKATFDTTRRRHLAASAKRNAERIF